MILILYVTVHKVSSYNSPDYLKQRHHLTDELCQLIAGIGNLLTEAMKSMLQEFIP